MILLSANYNSDIESNENCWSEEEREWWINLSIDFKS